MQKFFQKGLAKKRTGVKKFNYTLPIRDAFFFIREPGCLLIKTLAGKGQQGSGWEDNSVLAKNRALLRIDYQALKNIREEDRLSFLQI